VSQVTVPSSRPRFDRGILGVLYLAGSGGTLNCPSCEGKNRDDARFCTFCGTTLALSCSACGTDLVPGARFCDSCGAPVAAEPAAEPVAAARKVVTVLFADMTASTSLEEEMDAETVRSLIDRFYAALRAEVDKRGGRVVKFTGDGLMAAFGVPEVREDDAPRAIETALAMCSACEDLAQETGHHRAQGRTEHRRGRRHRRLRRRRGGHRQRGLAS
jgi:hypothetical protein